MTNSKILGLTIVIASILVASSVAMQSASAGPVGTVCSTDKNNPTTGNPAGTIHIANAGDDCYIGEYGTETNVGYVILVEAGKVSIVNTSTIYVDISGTTEKIKFKDNDVGDEDAIIKNNIVSHLEVMDNDSSGNDVPIEVFGNTADILKISGNGYKVNLNSNLVNDFAICKNNNDLTGAGNDYYGKIKGCP